MSNGSNDNSSGSSTDENVEEEPDEQTSTPFSPNFQAIRLGSKIQEQMAVNQEVIDQLVTGSELSEQMAANQEMIDQLVSGSEIADQIVANQKILDQVATGSKIQEQISANQEMVNRLVTGSELPEQIAANQEMLDQLVAGSEMMEQIQVDQEMIDRLVTGLELPEQIAANQEVLDQLVVGSEIMEQMAVSQEMINQLQQPAIDPELVSSLETLDMSPILELYETAAVLEQFSQRPQDTSVDQEELSNPTSPASNGFLSIFLDLTATYLLNSDESFTDEATDSLNAIIGTESVQIKTNEFRVAIQSLSGRGVLLATTGVRYALLFTKALYFPPDSINEPSEDE